MSTFCGACLPTKCNGERQKVAPSDRQLKRFGKQHHVDANRRALRHRTCAPSARLGSGVAMFIATSSKRMSTSRRRRGNASYCVDEHGAWRDILHISKKQTKDKKGVGMYPDAKGE